jgi:hypothetical protein
MNGGNMFGIRINNEGNRYIIKFNNKFICTFHVTLNCNFRWIR